MIRKKGVISLAPFSLSEVIFENNYSNCNIASLTLLFKWFKGRPERLPMFLREAKGGFTS